VYCIIYGTKCSEGLGRRRYSCGLTDRNSVHYANLAQRDITYEALWVNLVLVNIQFQTLYSKNVHKTGKCKYDIKMGLSYVTTVAMKRLKI
jgi:hypothetical protein